MRIEDDGGEIRAYARDGSLAASLTYRREGTAISTGQLWTEKGHGGAGAYVCYALRSKYPDETIVALVRPGNERAIRLHESLGGEFAWRLYVHAPKEKKKNGH